MNIADGFIVKIISMHCIYTIKKSPFEGKGLGEL